MSDHPEPLVASVAQFELALRRVKHGDPGRYVISWRHGNPLPILNALAKDTPFEDPGVTRQIVISHDLPSLFHVVGEFEDRPA